MGDHEVQSEKHIKQVTEDINTSWKKKLEARGKEITFLKQQVEAIKEEQSQFQDDQKDSLLKYFKHEFDKRDRAQKEKERSLETQIEMLKQG